MLKESSKTNSPRFASKVFALFALLGSLYAGTELILYFLLSIRFSEAQSIRPDPFGGISYKPNIINKLPGYVGRLGTDGYGFIHNGDSARIINKNDIFIHGGSTVEGRGSSSNNQTIAAQLEKCLNLQGDSRQVINVGFSGDTIIQQSQRLYGRVLIKYKPSLIIFLDGRNDAHTSTNLYYQPYAPNTGIHDIRESSLFENLQPKLGTNITVFIKRLKNRIQKEMRNSKKASIDKSRIIYESQAERSNKSSQVYLETSLNISQHLNERNIDFIHILQPYLTAESKSLTKTEEKLIEKYLNSFKEYKNNTFYSQENEYMSALKNFYRKSQNGNNMKHFFSFQDLFKNNTSTLYTDSVHYNDVGNKLIATKICQLVLNRP